VRGYAFLDHISYLLFAFHASEVSQGDMQRSPASFLWDSHGKLCRQADIALQVHYLSGPVAVADGGGEPAHPGDILVVRRRLQGNKTYAWRTRARCSAFCCTAGLSPDVVSMLPARMQVQRPMCRAAPFPRARTPALCQAPSGLCQSLVAACSTPYVQSAQLGAEAALPAGGDLQPGTAAWRRGEGGP
jgi:hypothetical protein